MYYEVAKIWGYEFRFKVYVVQVPATPDLVDSVAQDESEDEIFFGTISEKELLGQGSK